MASPNLPDDPRPHARVFLTGAQALVRLLIEQARRDTAAGLDTAGYVSGYRGSPLGGLDQELARAEAALASHRIRFQPGLNEELAATALWGTQQVGLFEGAKHQSVFGLWYGKGPGVDRSGDAFKHANLAGTAPFGGVLAVAGDDHGAASSTTAHQSEYAFVDAMIPVLAPATIQDILDMGLMGYALSRYAGCWVALKLAADVAEGAASVRLDGQPLPVTPTDVTLPPDGLHIRWPDRALDQEARLHGPKMAAVQAFVRANGLDVLYDTPNARRGIVASGKAWSDLCQVLRDLGLDEARRAELGLRLYKPALVWPLEPEGLLRFAAGLDEILVIEEKRPLIEDQIKQILYDRAASDQHGRAWSRVFGKRDAAGLPLVPTSGELSPTRLAAVLARWLDLPGNDIKAPRARRDKPVLRRTPHYCPGCPHSRSTQVPEGSRALAGIGCHTMALWTDAKTRTLTQMGGEGATWIGQAPFTDMPHVFQNIGDGTFVHSGLLAIRAAIAARVTLTYKLLYNDAVAMTGGQTVEGSLTVPRLARILEAEGAARIVVVAEEPSHYPASDPFPPGVRVVGRDAFEAVQEELRQVSGVSILIFDQTCAAEKRRRRKRGLLPPPERQAFINEQLCEGCGDCAAASNCLSVVPVETEWGRKRQIDLASCNADLSCVEGFCPSIVTIEGAKPKTVPSHSPAPTAPAPLPEPPEIPSLDRPAAILLAGIGGSGIVTLGRVIARAAHDAGYAVSLADQTGLAQKGGAVLSHLRIARADQELGALRIGPAQETSGAKIDGADLLLGGDLVVSASPDVLARAKPASCRAVINAAAQITGAFLREADKTFPADDLRGSLTGKLGAAAVTFVDAAQAAHQTGHAMGANLVLLGYAWQKGLLPLELARLRDAIAAETPNADGNLAAFDAGRRAAAGYTETRDGTAAALESLDDLIVRHSRMLTRYQNHALATRYERLVTTVREAEQRLNVGRDDMTRAVARNYAKLLAYKDEYESARLLTAPEFAAQVARRFAGAPRIYYHLAPTWLPHRRGRNGRPGKYRFGPWIAPLLRGLAHLRFLRGSVFDPFGHTPERRLERALIREYEQSIADLLTRLDADTYDAGVGIVRWPEPIRGFGIIKQAAAEQARRHRDEMFAAMNGPQASPLSSSPTSPTSAAPTIAAE